jgi:hypothetical protein
MPRTRKRIACRIKIKGLEYSGIVIDVSSNGLFVQTSASPPLHEMIEVTLVLPGGQELCMPAKVARKRLVPRQLLTVAHGGLGLHLQAPPEAYLKFVAEEQRER